MPHVDRSFDDNRLNKYGRLLFGYRKNAGLTQEELAEKVHLAKSVISELERGCYRHHFPRNHHILLADALALTEEQHATFDTAHTDAFEAVQTVADGVRADAVSRRRRRSSICPTSQRRRPWVLTPKAVHGRWMETGWQVRPRRQAESRDRNQAALWRFPATESATSAVDEANADTSVIDENVLVLRLPLLQASTTFLQVGWSNESSSADPVYEHQLGEEDRPAPLHERVLETTVESSPPPKRLPCTRKVGLWLFLALAGCWLLIFAHVHQGISAPYLEQNVPIPASGLGPVSTPNVPIPASGPGPVSTSTPIIPPPSNAIPVPAP